MSDALAARNPFPPFFRFPPPLSLSITLTHRRRARCARPTLPASALSVLSALPALTAAPWVNERRVCGAQPLLPPPPRACLSTIYPALSSPLFVASRGLHPPHALPVYEAPAECSTAGVCPTRHPRTHQAARAQPSFPAEAFELRALPKLLLCRCPALRAVCAPPHSSRATKSAPTATRARRLKFIH